MQFTKEQCHEFWKTESEKNNPTGYLLNENTIARTDFLIDIFRELKIPKKSTILELGCNCGRNLGSLWRSGWKNVSGIEINKNALELLEKEFPELRSKDFYADSIEYATYEMVRQMKKYDVIFSMAALVHIHPDSIDDLQYIKQIANKFIITFEFETEKEFKHPYIWKHDYVEIFADENWKLASTEDMTYTHQLENYKCRVFEKKSELF
jgi:2-polyprenyl-3-methyl-5-hydroxy-6-metoxy-1,4-benzoquinol methylase